MNIKGIIAFGGAQSLSNKEKISIKKDTISTVQAKIQNDLPSFAWKANMLPFGSIKISSDEFKANMKAKIDRVRKGSQENIRLNKKELSQMKTEAIKNIAGPLVLKCDALKPSDLKDLNDQFSKIKNLDDLERLLEDPRIPEDKPLIITEPSSMGFGKFIKNIDKANSSESLETAILLAEKATALIGNEDITIPELTIRTSNKDIAKGLIKHIKAELDYDPKSIISSPFFTFKTGDEIAIDLFMPVYN